MQLNKVFDGIKEKLETPEAEKFATAGTEFLALANPFLGAVASSISPLLNAVDSIKLKALLKGLASGDDYEKKINELYNYVHSSAKRAFEVGNIFKQTLLSMSPRICVVYGRILSKRIGIPESYLSKDETIICNALENANDYDLINFEIIMDKCIRKKPNGDSIIVFDCKDGNIADNKGSLEDTCLWCVANRLFYYTGWNDIEYSDDESGFSVCERSYLLIELIKEVKQIWNYE